MLDYMYEPPAHPSAEEELAREIISHVLDMYDKSASQSAGILDLTGPIDELLVDCLFKQYGVNENILNLKKTEILKLFDSILFKNEEISHDLTKLKSKIEKL